MEDDQRPSLPSVTCSLCFKSVYMVGIVCVCVSEQRESGEIRLLYSRHINFRQSSVGSSRGQ